MGVIILVGDVMEQLATLPDQSVHTCVTSPPYWALRDYGIAGQLGLEPTLGEHIDALVAVFREVRRVLRDDGTLWVNYGDCYAAHPNGRSAADTKAAGTDDRGFVDKPMSTVGGVIKPKDLCMMANRLAIALQDDGWWVRSEIIWDKPNPMPESVRDRPAVAHEKIWLLSKSARYFYDADAVRQPAAASSIARWAQNVADQAGSSRANGGTRSDRPMKAVGGPPVAGWADGSNYQGQDPRYPKRDKQRGHGRRHDGFNDRWDQMTRAEQTQGGHHLRTVWRVATKPFDMEMCQACGEIYLGRAAKALPRIENEDGRTTKVCTCGRSDAWLTHFATYPPDLIRNCILSGCPEGGTVLDPFGGAGTTGLVADAMRRNAVLIELNPDYARIAERRIAEGAGPMLGVGGAGPADPDDGLEVQVGLDLIDPGPRSEAIDGGGA